jgi:hypothetical protein
MEEWDQGKRIPRVYLWEALAFASLPVFLLIIVLGEYFEVSRLLLGFVFLLVPFSCVFSIMAFDQIRARGGLW